MSDINRDKIHRYFKIFPLLAAVFLAAGIMLSITVAGAIIGIPCLLISYLIHKADQKRRPSGEEMDQWLNAEMKDVQEKALSSFGIDPSQLVAEPAIITGPRFSERGKTPFVAKKGKDNIIRYNPLNTVLLNFGEDQLFCYQCCYDRISGAISSPKTGEFFYRDVVSVSTDTDNTPLAIEIKYERGSKTIKSTSRDYFKIVTTGGQEIKVVVKDEGLLHSLKGGEMPVTAAENAIQSMRAMLRNKKK